MKPFIYVLLFSSAFSASSQAPIICESYLPFIQPAAYSCEDACAGCGFNSLANYSTVDLSLPEPTSEGLFLGFIAYENDFRLVLRSVICAENKGMELSLLKTCGEVILKDSTGSDSFETYFIDVDSLIISEPYIVQVKGLDNDACTFNISGPSSAFIPNPGNPITNTTHFCGETTINYQIDPVENAYGYVWSADEGILINGMESPVTLFGDSLGNSATIHIDSTVYYAGIRVRPICTFLGSHFFVKQAPYQIQLQDTTICIANTPYLNAWGDTISNSGLYEQNFTSILGCDSLVQQQITIQSDAPTILPTINLLPGENVQICDSTFSMEGTFTVSCKSSNGCDSSVVFTIIQTSSSESKSKNSSISIAPTISSSLFNISILGEQMMSALRVFDNKGTLIKQDKTMNTNAYELDLSNFKSGTYIISVLVERQWIQRQIIKL